MLGSLDQAVCLPAKNSDISVEAKTLSDLHVGVICLHVVRIDILQSVAVQVKQRLAKLWSSTRRGSSLPIEQDKPHRM